jgi:hypothetical protein
MSRDSHQGNVPGREANYFQKAHNQSVLMEFPKNKLTSAWFSRQLELNPILSCQ